MNRLSLGLAACFAAASTAGCGTVTAGPPATGGSTTAAGHTDQATGTATHAPASPRQPSTRPASPRPAGTGAASSCRSVAPVGQILVVTIASNGKTYCVRVGDQVAVRLQGTFSSRWLAPLASSSVLRPVPNGGMSLIAGLTEEWFVGSRPGQVLITSIRPPCQGPVTKGQGGIEQASPLPRVYPLGSCAPERRFTVAIVVVT